MQALTSSCSHCSLSMPPLSLLLLRLLLLLPCAARSAKSATRLRMLRAVVPSLPRPPRPMCSPHSRRCSWIRAASGYAQAEGQCRSSSQEEVWALCCDWSLLLLMLALCLALGVCRGVPGVPLGASVM